MKTSIESIRNGLASQLTELDHELTAAVARVNKLKTTRRQVGAAIKALGSNNPGIGAVKPAPKKAQVQEAIDELLAENGEIATKDIEALVAEKLANEQGCSAMGLALRMREVLTSRAFVTIAGQLQRSSAAETTVATKC